MLWSHRCLPPSDLPTGSYIQEDLSRCSSLCEAGEDCCDVMASCKCGTHTGQYDCICEKGYYGKGLQHECTGGLNWCVPGPRCASPDCVSFWYCIRTSTILNKTSSKVTLISEQKERFRYLPISQLIISINNAATVHQYLNSSCTQLQLRSTLLFCLHHWHVHALVHFWSFLVSLNQGQ